MVRAAAARVLLSAAVLVTATGCSAGTPTVRISAATPTATAPIGASASPAPSSAPPVIATETSFFSVPTTSPVAMSVFDWAGQVISRATASVPLGCCTVEQSPDGSRLEVATSDGSVC